MSDDPMAITRRLYSGELGQAAVITSWDENDARQIGWSEIAAEAIRAINHLTSHGDPIPAPVAYQMLGDLQRIGHLLPQACEQLASGLQRSLEQHAVYESDGGDPTTSTAAACAELDQAAAAATHLGAALKAAQAAIASQGLRD